jgi:Rod binding domain-containing protein
MSSTPASLTAGLPFAAQSSPAQTKPRNAAEAAKQFEALMIAQMLRAAHESASGSLNDDDASSSDAMFDVAGLQFAQVLANNGGLGLAKMIVQGLQPK